MVDTKAGTTEVGSTTAREWIEYGAGAVLLAAVVLLLFYPGLMTKDSINSLRQARSLEFTDWHPPVMALLWRPLDALHEGPALMLLAQATLYGASVAFFAFCARGLLPRFQPWILVLLIGLFPPAFTLMGMIWKDVWMSLALLLSLCFVLKIQASKSTGQRWVNFGMVALFCLVATAFRHNALAATAGILAGACFYMARNAKRSRLYLHLLCSCVLGVLLSFLLAVSAGLAQKAIAKPTHPETTILLHDIAGTILNSGEPESAARTLLSEHPELSSRSTDDFLFALRRGYNPADANGTIRGKKRRNPPFSIYVYDPDHDAEEVRRAWVGTVRQYPVAYAKHRIKALICLLQLCDIVFWENASYVLNDEYVLKDMDRHSLRYQARDVVLNRAFSRIYSPTLWLVISLVAGFVAIARLGSRVSILLFMALSTLGLVVSMLFAAPIASFRYVHWVVLIGWLSAWILATDLYRRYVSARSPTRMPSS